MNQYQTANKVFKHLKSIFFNLNYYITARCQLHYLQMESHQKYHDFLAEFIYLADESQLHLEDYKKKLFNKLTDKLQNLTIQDYHVSEIFNKFFTVCSQAVYTLQINAEKFKAWNKFYKPAGTASAAKPCDKYTIRTAAPAAFKANRLDDKQRAELMWEEKCFYCKKTSYITPHCLCKKALKIKILKKKKKVSDENQNSEKTLS